MVKSQTRALAAIFLLVDVLSTSLAWVLSYLLRFHSALADSFRADLLAAARRGEAFYIDTGRPVSMARQDHDMSWYEFACKFIDMKWDRAAATTRRTNAEALTAVTVLMLSSDRGQPAGRPLRSALCRWGFNKARRDDPGRSTEVRAALRWVEGHTRRVSALRKPEVLRAVLDGLTGVRRDIALDPDRLRPRAPRQGALARP